MIRSGTTSTLSPDSEKELVASQSSLSLNSPSDELDLKINIEDEFSVRDLDTAVHNERAKELEDQNHLVLNYPTMIAEKEAIQRRESAIRNLQQMKNEEDLIKQTTNKIQHSQAFVSTTNKMPTSVQRIMHNAVSTCCKPVIRLVSSLRLRRAQIKGKAMTTTSLIAEPRRYRDMLHTEQRALEMFLMDLGYAFSSHGAPAHRVEYQLNLVAAYFGLDADTFVSPTGIFYSFREDKTKASHHEEQQPSRTTSYSLPNSLSSSTLAQTFDLRQLPELHMVRIGSATLDLYKLCEIDKLVDRLVRGSILSVSEAHKQLEAILHGPGLNWFIESVSVFPCSVIIAMIFGSSWLEIIGSVFTGLWVSIMCILARKVRVCGQAFNLFSSLGTTFIATVYKVLVWLIFIKPHTGNYEWFMKQRLSIFITSLAGIIYLVPGLTLTTATAEISHNYIVAGACRFATGIMTVMQVGLGLILGYFVQVNVMNWIQYVEDLTIQEKPESFPDYVLIILVFFVMITFMMQCRTPLKAGPIISTIAAGVIGFIVQMYTSVWLSDDFVSSFLGALVLGLIARTFSRLSGHLSEVISAPAISILVPGSVGVRGINSFVLHHIEDSMQFFFKMIMVALSLAMGLLVSNHLIPPKKKL